MSQPSDVIVPLDAAERPRSGGPLGQRRNFLVHPRYQLRASLLTTGVVVLLLVLINLSLYSIAERARAEIAAGAPEVAELLRSHDRIELGLSLAASLVFLVGVFVVGILETHKTAGAAFKLERQMAELEIGRYRAAIRLRRGDNLIELEQAFNRLARALEQRERDEAEALAELAARAPTDPGGAAAGLRALAALKRARID